MFTLFACPKGFVNPHISLIQRNAIFSWTLLNPRPEIILCGSEKGVAELSKELGLMHIRDISVNEFGTPLVNDIFEKAQRRASFDLLCYANADIIFTYHLTRAIKQASSLRKLFLVAGRRWDIDIIQPLDFSPGWERELQQEVLKRGKLRDQYMIDYFVFPRGLWEKIPQFALGRYWWDQWLLYRARCLNADLIDSTASVLAIHQRHDHSHHAQDFGQILPKPWLQTFEGRRNLHLSGGYGHQLDLYDATHRLTQHGMRLAWRSKLRSWAGYFRWIKKIHPRLSEILLEWFHRTYEKNIHKSLSKKSNSART